MCLFYLEKSFFPNNCVFCVFFKGCRAHLLSHSEKNESSNEFNMKLDDAIHVFLLAAGKITKILIVEISPKR